MGVSIKYSMPFDRLIEESVEDIRNQVQKRTYQAANELRNSALSILRGQGGGRTYRVPGTKRTYSASAPGEVPAVRTGAFRNSWQPTAHSYFGSYIARITSDIFYAGWLEKGTPGGQMAPRPHHEKILEHAKPKIIRIYSAPYNSGGVLHDRRGIADPSDSTEGAG